ncbi:MAG: zinc metalloprotease HtpX [Thermodesulfobacteriota bacterium]|nr:MAG: zinc metalloprotease HtpX [Thermodesulfobacteriota bacterium]
MTDFYSQQRKNRKITVLLMAGFFLFIIVLGLGVDLYSFGSVKDFGFPLGTVVALTVASVNGSVAYFYGDGIVLKSLGAVNLEFEDLTHKKLHNVVTEMALASGLPMPKIYVIPDPAPNAFATGRGPSKSSVVVTQGLLDTMNREELQGVVAHEMGHIKNLDILTMTVVAVLVGTVAILSDWAVRTWRYGGLTGRRRRRRRRGKGQSALVLIVIVVFVLISPIVSRIIAMTVSRSREYLADASSAEFTRNPGALASALEKIAGSTSRLKSAHRGTAHFFISDPMKRRLNNKEGRFANLLSTHPPIEKRIERLKKMAYIWKKRGIK